MIPSKFHRALLRLPEAQRPQHCYTTAAAMPLRKFPLAKELIEYSLELEGSWLDRMRAHSNLADLYERQGDYAAALQSYRLALEPFLRSFRRNIPPTPPPGCWSADSMRTVLHIPTICAACTNRHRSWTNSAAPSKNAFSTCPWPGSSWACTTATSPPPGLHMHRLPPCSAPATVVP